MKFEKGSQGPKGGSQCIIVIEDITFNPTYAKKYMTVDLKILVAVKFHSFRVEAMFVAARHNVIYRALEGRGPPDVACQL
jgi:hypothetical protein